MGSKTHALIRMFGVAVTMLIAMVGLSVFLSGCAGTGRPVSISSMPGRYVLSSESLSASGRDDTSALANLDLSALELELDSDGKGRLLVHSDQEITKRFSWRLDGGSKNPEILLTLNEALSAKDPWTLFLMTLESDPSHTKISGRVTSDGISIRQRDGEDSFGITLVFVRADDATG